MSKISAFLSGNTVVIGGIAVAAAVVGFFAAGVFDRDAPEPVVAQVEEPAQAPVEGKPEAEEAPVEEVTEAAPETTPEAEAPEAAEETAEAEAEAEPETAATLETAEVEEATPTFDVVRVEKDGTAVIAGSANEAGGDVRILLDGE